jgi:hypothetical protein
MKTAKELKEYKTMYYIYNRKKLIEYSQNYYKYRKCDGELTDGELTESMNRFLISYKGNNRQNENYIEIINIKINKEPIIIKFD